MAEDSFFEEEEQDPRAKREHSSREVEARTDDSWLPPSVLPVPDPQDGYAFRWIRVAIRSDSDLPNVSKRFREGWEPVKLEDHPELKLLPDIDTRWDGNAVLGGLMLCKIAEERLAKQRAYFRKKADTQMEVVDRNFMRENDARMPLLPPERKTRVTFGDGS